MLDAPPDAVRPVPPPPPDNRNDDAIARIDPMLNILKDMISYGYVGDLLDPMQFNIIMRKYVEFIIKLIDFFAVPFLCFYCVNTTIQDRDLTSTERFFMNLLENSNQEPISPPPAPPPMPSSAQNMPSLDEAGFDQNILSSLTCIEGIEGRPGAITAIREMHRQTLMRLCQNKVYASSRDTKNKTNSIVVISIAYQSFLWDTKKLDLIKIGNMTDNEREQDTQNFFVGRNTGDMNSRAIGLRDIFTTRQHQNFFDSLLAALAPCYGVDPQQNLLDISTQPFDGIEIDNPIKFQFMFWFITCVFGIKTKSAPKKIISLARTYLNNISRELQGLKYQVFGCEIIFPEKPDPRPAPIEEDQEEAGGRALGNPALGNPLPNNINFLYLAYDTYAINLAYNLYKKANENLGGLVKDAVFKFDKMIAIHKDSLVLRKDVVSRLIIAFSKKPRGQVYVNQSSMFMNPILTNVTSGIERLLQHENIMTTIGDILSLILEMAPNILTDNPYIPPEHDISKFMDFEIDPQSYRNEWIVLFGYRNF
jgi:hypothetical protein